VKSTERHNNEYRNSQEAKESFSAQEQQLIVQIKINKEANDSDDEHAQEK